MTVTCPLCRQPDVLVEDRTSPPTLTAHYLPLVADWIDKQLAVKCPASYADVVERVGSEER